MGMTRSVAVLAGAGYGATALMDRATTYFQEHQSRESREREEQVQSEPATTVLAKKVAHAGHTRLSDDAAERLGMVAHFGLGISGAFLARLLMRGGRNPILAGVGAGMLIWVVVDEGLNYSLGLTPPATEYPMATHARGLVGHVAYGLGLGFLLAVGKRLMSAPKP